MGGALPVLAKARRSSAGLRADLHTGGPYEGSPRDKVWQDWAIRASAAHGLSLFYDGLNPRSGIGGESLSRQQRSRLQRTRSLRHWEEAVLLLITPAGSFFRTGKRCTRPNCMLWLSFPGRALPQFYAPPRHPPSPDDNYAPLATSEGRFAPPPLPSPPPLLEEELPPRLHRSSCWLL